MKKSPFSFNQISVLFFYFSFCLFVGMFCIGRLVLIQEVVGAKIVLQALFIDLGVAVFIALLIKLLHKVHIVIASVVLLFLSLFHIANMEMAAALNTYINIVDLHYATDTHFIRGTLSNLTFPWYSFFLLFSVILYLISLTRIGKKPPIKLKYLALCMLALLLCIILLSPRGGQWPNSNLLWLSFTRSIARTGGVTDHGLASEINADIVDLPPPGPENDIELFFNPPPSSNRNVLFVVIDGIPGVYVKQVQEWTGVKYPVVMRNLSRIAERSLIVPNFIAHNRQTIRGLYSLLSGDYPKLSITTPKIYEYVQLPRELRPPCLPEILASFGYTTVYLQAADLAFMSKNKFMPESGFQLVMGKEIFRYQHVPFGWGPDDKAFFEQAADFIENLDKTSKPWFVTLLNVGTHHPYAVPEEWESKFSSRKEAVIAYLDEAVGQFFNRLEQSGILNDTLLLITSDESHGVTGQPYGNYWGLAVVCSPESYHIVNPGTFGLIDIPYSVLDYLDLNEVFHSFPHYSIFRKQSTERPILFDAYFSEMKGVVSKRINPSCVKIFRSSNGELFSSEYEVEIVKGEAGRRASEELRDYQRVFDSSLYNVERKDRIYVLLEDDEFIVRKNGSRLLSSGQYLDIPGGTTVTVELEATVRLDKGYDENGNNESIRLVLQMLQWYKKMPIPEIRIPILKDQDSLHISFSFYAEVPLLRVWAYLKAVSVNPSYATRLIIERFSIETEESDTEHEFRIDRFLIENKEGKSDLKPIFFGTNGSSKRPIQQYQPCSKMERIDSHFKDQLDPDVTGSWVDGKDWSITCRVGKLDQRFDHYIILVNFESAGQGLDTTQDVCASLNQHPVGCRWVDLKECKKEVLLFVARTLLKENDINKIELFLAGSPTDEVKHQTFKLPTIVLRPSPPFIAHAGGGYRGLTYTNSIEALEENAASFTLFEIDFEWTKDNHLVGLHDWKDIFTRLYGFEAQGPLKYDTFKKLESPLKITPVDLSSIKEFLWRNPAARIVTDIKFDNIKALYRIARFFPDFAERFIPQVYQPDGFSKAIEIGYPHVIWTLYQYRNVNDPIEIQSHLSSWRSEYNTEPFAVTMPVHAVERGIAKVVTEAGIPVYVHTVNTCDEYIRLLRLGASSIYTDCLDITTCF
jgi:glycerophosphoryl diester phosphodiesterase